MDSPPSPQKLLSLVHRRKTLWQAAVQTCWKLRGTQLKLQCAWSRLATKIGRLRMRLIKWLLPGIAKPSKVRNIGLAKGSTRSDVIEGMLSCQQTQNVIDGKKRIILNPSEQQKREFETITFAEDEVYGIDILVSTGEDGKVKNFLCTSSARICHWYSFS